VDCQLKELPEAGTEFSLLEKFARYCAKQSRYFLRTGRVQTEREYLDSAGVVFGYQLGLLRGDQ